MSIPFRYSPVHGGKPDPERCAASVRVGNWHRKQCERPRVVGEWCKQHDPVACLARAEKNAAAWKARRAQEEKDRRERGVAEGLRLATVDQLVKELERRGYGVLLRDNTPD